jgi:hypothetical protein
MAPQDSVVDELNLIPEISFRNKRRTSDHFPETIANICKIFGNPKSRDDKLLIEVLTPFPIL